MARKRKPVKTTREAGDIYTADPLALNQWCIEMALRWPRISDGFGGSYGAGMSGGRIESDADLIGRANKIMDWVKKRH